MAVNAEKLQILLQEGDEVAVRMQYLKDDLIRNRPLFLVDAVYGKVVGSLVKKFPDPNVRVESLAGFDAFSANMETFLGNLQEHYDVFVDLMRWKELAFALLTDISNGASLQISENPFLTYNFLRLVTLYVKLHVFMSTIQGRKPVLAVYGKCYQLLKTDNEPDFSKVSLYVCEFDNPFRRIQAQFKPFSTKLAGALVGLKPVLDKFHNLQLLRNDATLCVALNQMLLAWPAQDQFEFDAVYYNRFHEWVLFGFLFTPEEYLMKETMPMVRLALKQCFWAPLFRSSVIQIHTEYETMFSSYKSQNKTLKLKKEKKTIQECLANSVGAGGKYHKQMRTFFRQELKNVINLVEDFPGLMGPKHQLLMALLALSKDEVAWYYRHRTSGAPKQASKYFKDEDYRDPNVLELIHLMQQAVALIRRHKQVVQVYYLEYLRGSDCKRLKELVAQKFSSMTPGKVEMDAVQRILKELEAIDVQGFVAGRVDYDFSGLRMNWYRVESAMSLSTSPVSIASAKELSLKFHSMVHHTRNVDSIDEQLDEFASLSDLWAWKIAIMSDYDTALAARAAPYVASVFELMDSMPHSATKYRQDEKARIGAEVVAYCEKFLTQMADKISFSLGYVAREYIKFDHQLDADNAAYHLLSSCGMKLARDPPVTPGTESFYKNKMETIPIRMSLRAAWALCTVMQQLETVVVWDTQFAPREFLHEKIAGMLRMFIKQSSNVMVDKEPAAQIPSVLEVELRSYRSLLINIETYLNLNIAHIVQEVTLGEVHHPEIKMVTSEDTSFAWLSNQPLTGLGKTMAGRYAAQYANHCSQRLTQTGFVVYSPGWYSFLSKPGSNYRAEEYYSLPELRALVRMIGPYGARTLDRELCRSLIPHMAALKGHLTGNQPVYEELAKTMLTPLNADLTIRKIRDLDSFVNACLAIGTILSFRKLLAYAVRFTMRATVPVAWEAAALARAQYVRNTLLSSALLPMDAVAIDCGLEEGIVDQSLSFVARSAFSGNANLADLLPAAFTAAFFSKQMLDSVYIPSLESHTNNTNVLPATFAKLMFAIKASTSQSPEVEQEISDLHSKFVDYAGYTLLRLSSLPANDLRSYKITSLPSLAIHLDLFVQATPLVTQNQADAVLPYSLLRSFYRDIYSSPPPKGWNFH